MLPIDQTDVETRNLEIPVEPKKKVKTTKTKTPTENKGKTPTENKGKTPTENKGKTPTENKGQTPTENKGKMPKVINAKSVAVVTKFKANKMDTSNNGRIDSVSDGIAKITGLDNVQAGELVNCISLYTEKTIQGMALNLESRLVGIVLFTDINVLEQGDLVV